MDTLITIFETGSSIMDFLNKYLFSNLHYIVDAIKWISDFLGGDTLSGVFDFFGGLF